MAYMNQQTKKQLEPAIKAVLKKYGMNGTLAVRNNSTLMVNIKAGKLDIIGNYLDKVGRDRFSNFPRSLQVYQYSNECRFTGSVLDFMNELFDAMRGAEWYDRSDAQTDYFDTAYYMNVNVGQWDKPYIFEGN
jgi:hypothetical protein